MILVCSTWCNNYLYNVNATATNYWILLTTTADDYIAAGNVAMSTQAAGM